MKTILSQGARRRVDHLTSSDRRVRGPWRPGWRPGGGAPGWRSTPRVWPGPAKIKCARGGNFCYHDVPSCSYVRYFKVITYWPAQKVTGLHNICLLIFLTRCVRLCLWIEAQRWLRFRDSKDDTLKKCSFLKRYRFCWILENVFCRLYHFLSRINGLNKPLCAAWKESAGGIFSY